ncbi:phosphomevalonate kinase [Tessaracoccus caeni]|uniref:phosphomevalonate kinase n=1 Tax=Tessaracoccus caeni TaxID=3031239 RepID=UPI0023DAD3AE|nr:phosphomevalonate kinase [Tessaracoccus caeni]MDF1488603.1 phosphomevalonate kinase [Tessaracoccus caeni]
MSHAWATEVRAPGKLYVAGEYAVVEAGFPAVLVAVDRYVTVRVRDAAETGRITSDLHAGSWLEWYRRDSDMVVEPDHAPFSFVLAAIRVVEEVALALGEPLKIFDLNITSELDDDSGRKFGLGSSAAVTVATVRALCAHYRLDLSRMEQLKLALLASIEVQRSGSGGDIVASMFGGWIAYTAFDREWVRAARRDHTSAELLTMEWPGLSVRRVPPPEGLRLLVGWTGSPASTSRLVGAVQARKSQSGLDYLQFLTQSRWCVDALIEALDEGRTNDILAAIRRNRELLRELGERTGMTIETPTLRHLIETAEQHGGAAKTSGAGGGDCGIVLIDDDANVDGLLAAWERADIRVLNLHVHQPEGQMG